MLPFENMVADYVKETDNHVIYRVTPIFEGDNLLATGVLIEAYSVEDEGEGICFNVFCYNVQDGVIIDYATGENTAAAPEPEDKPTTEPDTDTTYVLNTSSKKVHLPECRHAETIAEKNRQETDKSEEELIEEGYEACKTCKPFG